MKNKHQSGQSIVEFAFVLPLLLLVVFGIIEFGLVLFNKAVITNASREGARAGIVSQNPRVTDVEITNIVNTYCAGHLVTFSPNAPVATISRGPGASPYTITDHITVMVDYDYGWLVIPNFTGLPNPVRLRATTVMRFE